MLNMYLYFFFLFVFFIFFFFSGIIVYYLDMVLVLEWLLYSNNSFNMEILLMIDWISLIFISVVLMISSMVMLYSTGYMMGDLNLSRFYILILLFVFSMILMIISPNVVSILFGWDGLGVTSYCLVIYYQNYMSYNSGMVTVLINRVGDIGLLMSISIMLMYGSWNISSIKESKLIIIMLIMAGITKSAQIPFSSWLPMAMAAPTPVSSLVHSSTLVTAGVYLMIRFMHLLELNKVGGVLLFLAVCTMFMSGLMANFETDLKKIIALSTLSQLGLMMSIVSMGLMNLSFYHLLTHALFKSMLFLCAGILIHSMNNNQDIRSAGGLSEVYPYVMMSFMISSFALCGYPFLAGFYSKDLIMEALYDININLLMLILSVFSLSFTVSYSLRLFFYLYMSEMKFSSGWKFFEESNSMNFSMILLMVMSIIGGSFLNWMFFFNMNFFFNISFKLLTIMMCFVGVFFMFLFFKMKLNIKVEYFFSSMWFMNYMYTYMNKPFLFGASFLEKMEKTWFEYFNKGLFMDFLLSIFFSNKKYSEFYKIYMFIMYMYLCILLAMMY